MPWAGRAGAVLITWYPGEEGADALADIAGRALRPRGPAAGDPPRPAGGRRHGGDPARYPGRDGTVVYGEGVFVGYRHQAPHPVPLGHGLSYGEIAYDEVTVTPETVRVRPGQRGNATVAPRWCRCTSGRSSRACRRPDRELVGFSKVVLEAGQQETVEVGLDAAATRYWDVDTHGWRTDPGRYEVLVGSSSSDIKATDVITLT